MKTNYLLTNMIRKTLDFAGKTIFHSLKAKKTQNKNITIKKTTPNQSQDKSEKQTHKTSN